MGYKVGDRVKVVRADLDIFRKTAVVVNEALPNHGYVLVKLDNPDPQNVSQLGRVSLHENWLTRVEE